MAFSPGFNRNNQEKKEFQKRDYRDPELVELYKSYAGTGNKEAPQNILDRFTEIARVLDQFGYTLRTGGFDGPEEYFEKGSSHLELHLPWKDFNKRDSKLTFTSHEAMEIARKFHPTFDGLSPAIQKFLAKNVRTLLGKDLKSAVRFVICWSEDGAETIKEKSFKTGNIGHVLAIASAMRIPVFNFGKPDAEERLRKYLEIPDGRNNSTRDNSNEHNQPAKRSDYDDSDFF